MNRLKVSLLFWFGLGCVNLTQLAADQKGLKDYVQDLSSGDPAAENNAKKNLRNYRFNEVAKAMSRFAKDPNPEIRIMWARTLGELGGPEASPLLKKAYQKEKEDRVRRGILIQLSAGRLSPPHEQEWDFFKKVALEDGNDEIRALALIQLWILGKPQNLKSQLEKVSWKVWSNDRYNPNRLFSAVTLVEAGQSQPELLEAVFEALKSPKVELRRRASAVLPPLKDEKKIESAVTALHDSDPEVRANLCRALGRSGNPGVVPSLKALSSDKEPLVRKNAIEGLAALPDKSGLLPDFINALKDPDPSIRSSAISILEQLGDPQAVPALKEVADSDPDPSLQYLAKKAIITIQPQK